MDWFELIIFFLIYTLLCSLFLNNRRKFLYDKFNIIYMKKISNKEHKHLFELYKAKKTLEIQRCVYCGFLRKYYYETKTIKFIDLQ